MSALSDIFAAARPLDAQGNPIPLATVEIVASQKTIQNLALIVLGAVVLNKIIPNPNTRK